MNGFEQMFANLLHLQQCDGRVVSWQFEGLRLHLGGGAWYKPDFAPVCLRGGDILIYEVKGHWREAARLRMKVAAENFPMFTFYAVTNPTTNGLGWDYEPIRPVG